MVPWFLQSEASLMKKLFSLIVAAAVGALALAPASGCRRNTPLEPSPAAVEAVNLGVALMGQYDYDAASQAFEDALAAAPDHPEIKVNLAIARFNRGRKEDQDIEKSTELLEEVLRESPDHARAWYFKGIVLQHLGRAEEAIPCFEKVLQQHPDDGVAWYILGMCRQRVGQDAFRELARAIELHPYLASAYYRVWQMLQAAGESERATPYLEQFKKLREHPLAETIELPQYNQMGDLALVIPIGDAAPAASGSFVYRGGATRDLVARPGVAQPGDANAARLASTFGGVSILNTGLPGGPTCLLGGWMPDAGAPVHASLGATGVDPTLQTVTAPLAWSIGDYDNDGIEDVFVVAAHGNELFRGTPEGGFTRTTGLIAQPASGGASSSALWLDTDHDGDLDLFVCNVGAPNQLFNNNADGTFTDIATSAGIAMPEGDSVMVLPGDLDGDRDMDLIVLRRGAPARIFLNELSGTFAEATTQTAIRGDLGGVLQDFDGDGILDLLTLSDRPAMPALHLGGGRADFRASAKFAEAATGAAALGKIGGVRTTDVDLDGDLDVALFGEEGHLLLNDGAGAFTLQARVWQPLERGRIVGAELVDVTGDLIPDAILLERGETDRVRLVPGEVSPAPTAIAIAPTGVRSRDKRTRSPASGYGVRTVVRTGLREQSRWNTGQAGGFGQGPQPLVFGLAGATHVDYARLHWPDGVSQVERTLAAGRTHVVAESQRKVSSCPVLFTWNGDEFEFITDFAGVGGLGYFAAPGEYAYPQPVDHVKIEPHQLRPRHGRYEIRITEPMEESAYVDRLELLAIDHPQSWQVFPDERLAVTGPAPTHQLLVVERAIAPARATGPAGIDCTEAVLAADRRYAYEPALDARFVGFCEPHALELDFADQLAALPRDSRVFLFIVGYLEYPYSQTTYAAGQAHLGWQPVRIDRAKADGTWETIVPDAGALSGMSRSMTVDLTGLLTGPSCRLRLVSNLEMYYDQIFLAAPLPAERVTVHAMPVAEAELRYSGFAREVAPDGLSPTIYDYQQTEPDAPFRSLSGAYTRYGPVRELLADDDDMFVLMASGDEIAASFEATGLPEPAAGMTRSFVLVSHAYCKDMDFYTGTPNTLAPMPFRGMSRYPYPEHERPAETDEQRRVRETYHTRIIE